MTFDNVCEHITNLNDRSYKQFVYELDYTLVIKLHQSMNMYPKLGFQIFLINLVVFQQGCTLIVNEDRACATIPKKRRSRGKIDGRAAFYQDETYHTYI